MVRVVYVDRHEALRSDDVRMQTPPLILFFSIGEMIDITFDANKLLFVCIKPGLSEAYDVRFVYFSIGVKFSKLPNIALPNPLITSLDSL